MDSRALSFGAVAPSYERYRLGYPDRVVDLVLGYAAPPVERALEVGAGTGKATRLFAARGIAVTACEPDPQMAATLTQTCAELPVEVVVSTFEAFPTDRDDRYDLLLAATSWHWTEPTTRWSHTAELVRPGGTVALFGSAGAGSRLADDGLRDEVAGIRRRLIPDEERLTQQRVAGLWWPGSELVAEPTFADVVEHDLSRTVERSRDDFVGSLGTTSAYLMLADDDRAGVLREIAAALPSSVLVEATVRLHLARRR